MPVIFPDDHRFSIEAQVLTKDSLTGKDSMISGPAGATSNHGWRGARGGPGQ